MSNSPSSPTLTEVENYAEEIGSPVAPVKFYKYYQDRGWVSKGEPIDDWKAVFRHWTKNERPKPKKQYITVEEHHRTVRIDKEKLRVIYREFCLTPEDIGEETYRVLFRD